MPKICVCTAPATPTVHRSDDEEFTDGEIAEGGGEITTVLPFVVISESLFVVDSTTVCEYAVDTVDIIKRTASMNLFITSPTRFY